MHQRRCGFGGRSQRLSQLASVSTKTWLHGLEWWMVARVSLLDRPTGGSSPCTTSAATPAHPEVLATVPVVVLSGSDARLHVCRARLDMLTCWFNPKRLLMNFQEQSTICVPTLTVSFRPVGRGIFLSLTYVGCCHVHTPPALMRIFWWMMDPGCIPRTFCLLAFALSVCRMICLSSSHLFAMLHLPSFRLGPGPRRSLLE